MDANLTEPAKLLLLAALLVKDNIISCNAKAFLKELILRRDSRLLTLLQRFESKETGDTTFLDQIHNLIEDESFAVYSEIFNDTSLEVGKTLSKGERDDKDLNDEKSLIYGEVDYSSFYRVLRKINPAAGGTFYDLGSGTGKAVIAARLTCDFSRCMGIEILESLHTQGAMIMHRFNESYQDLLSAGMHQMAAVFEGSFLSYDWSDGDVVFANSTCYDEKLMSDMAGMARSLKPGAFFVTFTKGLNIPDAFEVIERKRYRMSWGPATVFIHRRLNDDGSSVGPFKLNLLPSDEVSYSDDEDNDKWRDESDSSDDDDDYDDDDDDECSSDESEDESDEDSGEIDYEAYLRDRAKFYSDYDGLDMGDDDDDDDDDEDDEDYEPESEDEEDDSDGSYESEESAGSDEDEEFDQAEFYKAMEILNMGGSRGSSEGSGSRSGSNKSTPSSSRGGSNASTPNSSNRSTPPRSSPSQSNATPPSYHSGPKGSPSSGNGSSPTLQVNVPSRLQAQNFQESIGSPQDAALLRKKNRSRVASKNKAIGAGY